MLEAAATWLAGRGVEAPRLSAEWMLAHVLGVTRLQVYLAHDRPLAEREKARLRGMVARRGSGEPLAYILGDQEFCGLDLEVTKDVLIPRPETAWLVDYLGERLPEGSRGTDLGTGSGAIAVALCHRRPDVSVLATDVSAGALEVAGRNAVKHGVADRIAFRRGSWWGPLCEETGLDFAVCNPPYVDPDRPDLLAAGVREFEPAVALFTPPGDPAAPYRDLVAGLPHLGPGALVALETGVGAAEAALAVLAATPTLANVRLENDDAGLPRYLVGSVVPTPRSPAGR